MASEPLEPQDPPEPTDADIEASLRAGAPDDWQALWAAMDSLTPADNQAAWSRDGWATYSVPVNRILGLWQSLRIVQPLDWVAWNRTAHYPGGAGLDEAPVAEAVRMATTIVRTDRFAEGTIEAALKDGTFHAVLRRLRLWHEEPV